MFSKNCKKITEKQKAYYSKEEKLCHFLHGAHKMVGLQGAKCRLAYHP